MERVISISVFMLVLSGAVFAEDGVNGWIWEKVTDSMTDQVQFTFLKGSTTGDDPAVMLIYMPSRSQWVWGFFSESSWDNEEITYRLGKDPAQTESFVTDGKRIYTSVNDLAQFLSYSSLVMRPRLGEEYRYDMRGLAKTIRMAGLSLK